jgi:hypothetical protein
MTERMKGVFGKPFAEQVAAFLLRLRNPVSTYRWDDQENGVWKEQHDSAWMVAGAIKADLLADIGAALAKAQFQGGTLETFTKDFYRITAEKGWPGKAGLGSKKGEAWRIKLIYQTNMRTSWAAGNMAQLVKLGYKYWVYRHGGSVEPRIIHLSWDGVALPPDHPFWATHAPPNGWGCSCRIRGADSDAGIRRAGGDPGKTLPEGWQSLDPKTGAPVGIDKGWDYKVGGTASETIRAMTEKTVHWPTEIAKAYMAEVPERVRDDFARGYRSLPSLADDVLRWVTRVLAPKTAPEGPSQPDQYRTLGLVRSDQAKIWGPQIEADLRLSDFTVSQSAVRHVIKNHGNVASEARRGQRGITPADFGRLAEIVENPDEVLPSGKRLVMRKRFGSEIYEAIFEHFAQRKMLSLVTMFVKVVAP